MNVSPLRSLVLRRVCRCNQPSSLLRAFSSRTPLFTHGSPVASYGSSELLRRRYKKTTTPEEELKAEKKRIQKRMRYASYGIVLCALGMYGVLSLYDDPRKQTPPPAGEKKHGVVQNDAPPSPTAIQIATPEESEAEVEQVATGTSTIPHFPRFISLPGSNVPTPSSPAGLATDTQTQYQLVGLGVRTVSILSIQVYVVGIYVAVPDIAALQARLVKSVADGVATTLVPGEKATLRDLMRDPARGEELWNELLRDGQLRTAVRIVPTRNTDFMHLRDGFVRGITARSAHFAANLGDASFQDESFGASLNDFKTAFGGSARRRLQRGEVLLLGRGADGAMSVWAEDKRGDRLKMGDVADERVGRLLWLNYLAGKAVASEDAKESVIAGLMDFVERPVGTVATQVV